MQEVVHTVSRAYATVPSTEADIRSWIVNQPADVQAMVAPLFRDRIPSAEAIRDRLAMLTWRARWIDEYRSWLRRLEQGTYRIVRHLLIIDGHPSDTTTDQVRGTIMTIIPSVRLVPLTRREPITPLLEGTYYPNSGLRDRDVYLAPFNPALPLVQCLEVRPPLRGMWSPDVWSRLFAEVETDLWLVIGMSHVPSTVMSYQLEHMMRSARTTANRDLTERGRIADRLFQRARTERGYDVALAIAIRASTLDQITKERDRVRAVLSGFCADVAVPPGRQAIVSTIFQPTPLPEPATARLPSHRALSGDVVRTLNLWVRSWPYRRGMVWGLSRNGAICVEPMHGGTAAHMVVIGKTGSGKTFAVNTIALRCATTGMRVIFFDPQGHVKRLMQAADTGGVHRPIRARERYNILDVTVSGGTLQSPPIAEQIGMVIGLLGLILGSSTLTPSGAVFRPREWTSLERGVLEHALGHLYAPWRDRLADLTPEETPILSDLVACLTSLEQTWRSDPSESRHTLADIAAQLITELTVRIIDNPNAQLFNARTSIRWDFQHDLICYDLSETPTDGIVRSLVMVLGIGALLRTIRREAQRSRSAIRPTLVIIDEFGSLMMTSPDIAAYAAEIAKTGRAFQVGLVAIDQDAQTFLDPSLDPMGYRRTIWNNAVIRLIFRQDRANSEQVVQAIDGLTPSDRDRLMSLGRGDALFVWEAPSSQYQQQELTWMHIEPTTLEQRILSGT